MTFHSNLLLATPYIFFLEGNTSAWDTAFLVSLLLEKNV